MMRSLIEIKRYVQRRLKLRKVYTIAFACDQTIEYWTGSFEFPNIDVRFTHLGKNAWRSDSKADADKFRRLIEDGGGEPMVSLPTWEFMLDREDWTW